MNADIPVSRERELVRAAREGDPEAFCALVRPYMPTLRARARRAVRTRSEIDPEEIVQETLIRSFRALPLYDERHTFAQFLFGIARLATLKHVAGRTREIAVAWSETVGAEESESTLLPGEAGIPDEFRGLAGADRFPSPDARTRSRDRFRFMLEVLFAHGGYPHQQVAFCYSVLLWGKPKARGTSGAKGRVARRRPDKVEVTGDPDRVVLDLSDVPLQRAGSDFRVEIEGIEHLNPRDFDGVFRPFDFRIGLRGRDLFAKDPASRAQFPAVAEARIGDTRLEDYYAQDPRRSVADWSRAVKDKVRRHICGDAGAARSTLPMPPGPDDPPITGQPGL